MNNISFLAAIEVGSHEVILKIVELNSKGEVKELESVSKTINLGSDSYRLGYITNDNIHHLISTLKDFKQIISSYPKARIKVSATSAIREASNRLFILDQVKNQTGFCLEILSNREEIADMMRSVIARMKDFPELSQEATLLVDIGAGSTQLTLFDEARFIFTQNILLGSLRVRDRLSVLEQHTADFQALMQEYISGDLDYYRSFVPPKISYKNFVLVGNLIQTWRYLADLPFEGTVALPKDKFLELYKEITHVSNLNLIEHFEINEEQASILLPMSMVLNEIFNITNLDYVLLPDATLADGLIVRLIEEIRPSKKSPRIERYALDFAKEVALRHHTDWNHIQQVKKISLELFDQLEQVHGLEKRDRFLLNIAAVLHNIGKFFTVKQDGDIAYQLIKSLDIPDLNNEELEIIALLVRDHSAPIFDIKNLKATIPDNQHLILVKLSVLLALANSLDTGHSEKVKSIKTEFHKKHIKLFVGSNDDLTLEYWSVQKPLSLFESVFGKELRLVIVPANE